MERENYAPIGGREYLLAGSLTMALSGLFKPFSLIVSSLGMVVYVLGLYFWSVEVDSRPLKLYIIETALLLASLPALSWGVKWALLRPSWGIYKLINSLAPAYPIIVASALVYRLRMGIFAGSTDELNFNLAGNLYLIGALLFPVLVGVVLMSIARLIEAYSYRRLPLTARKGVPLNFRGRKALAVLLVSIILTPAFASLSFNHYDRSERMGDVALYVKTLQSGTVLDVLGGISKDSCGVNVYVDGNRVAQNPEFMAFWGPFQSLLALPGKGVVRYHLELREVPKTVTVALCKETYHYSRTPNGYSAEKDREWQNVTFRL